MVNGRDGERKKYFRWKLFFSGEEEKKKRVAGIIKLGEKEERSKGIRAFKGLPFLF